MLLHSFATFTELTENISTFINKKKEATNHEMLLAYWNIGGYIVLSEQKGNKRATYGTQFLENLATDLSELFGKGFSRSNLIYMRKLFLFFPTLFEENQIRETPSESVSWSHYFEMLKLDDRDSIEFYIKEVEKGKWSVRTLKRHMKNLLHYCISYMCGITTEIPELPKEEKPARKLSEGSKSIKSWINKKITMVNKAIKNNFSICETPGYG